MKTFARFRFMMAILCILACCSQAYAVPGLISYQGILNDADGAPATGSKTITFSMYTTATGGTALWSESHTADLADGVFNVLLGSSQAFPEALFQNEELYLGVKVGMDAEMTPRQRITSNAFSQRSGLLDFGQPIGSITAWAKDLPGVPDLPEGWVECNGQVLSDPESPMDGQTVPDLNGQNRFLRGNAASGDTGGQESATTTTSLNHHAASAIGSYMLYASTHGHTHTVSTIPPFYSVVWIMKIK